VTADFENVTDFGRWGKVAAGLMLIGFVLKLTIGHCEGNDFWSIDCWHATVGARWRPTRDTPRATH